MAKFNNEMKTGIIVIAAVAVFFYISLKIQGPKATDSYKLNVLFDYVSGLEDKAPVKLAGVEVGEVEKVTHSYAEDETKVAVILALSGEAKVRKDSEVRISTTGLIGEKYVEITGGSKGSPFIPAGSTIVGVNPFEMEELIEMGKGLAARLDSAMQDLQKLMGHADGVLVDNKDDIRATIVNLKESSENLKEFSDEVKRNPWKLLIKGKEVAPCPAEGKGGVPSKGEEEGTGAPSRNFGP